MHGTCRTYNILSAALITLSFFVEIALIPRFISISLLQIMFLFGVTAYGILVLSSWLSGEDRQKKNVAVGCALTIIIIGTIFIGYVLGTYYIGT